MRKCSYLTAVCLACALLIPTAHTHAETSDHPQIQAAETRENPVQAAQSQSAAEDKRPRKVHAVSGASMAKRRAAKKKKKQQAKN
ncbi:MAG: hypothetical protein SOX97_02250 [Sutterella sp.]|nr:hypothetical protein [Sutterella sp.]